MNKQREPGYYWVKLISWVVAHYSPEADRWVLPGNQKWFNDSNFQEIDENRIQRSEKAILTDDDYAGKFDNPLIERTCRDDGGPAFNYP